MPKGANVDGRYRAVWLIVAQGGWWKVREIKDLLPEQIPVVDIRNYLWVMANRHQQLVTRGEGTAREYSVAPECRLPMGLTASDVVGALVGQESTTPTPRSDLWLMRQSLTALDGVLEMAQQRGIKPTEITLTTRDSLRRRLANSALAQHTWGTA